MIQFIVTGFVQAQERPRLSRMGKVVRTHDVPKSRQYKELVKIVAWDNKSKDTEEIIVEISGLTLERCQDFERCIVLNDNKEEPTLIVMDSNEMNWLDHTKELILIISKQTKSEKVMLEDAGLRHIIAISITVKKQQ